jgi:DNA-binding transcriptional LysR family regulator
MLKDELPDLATFAAIAELGSFTRAAARLGMSQSALSHAVRRLEARLGVRLLTRTTRSVAPTAAGERLLASLRPALDQIGGGLEAIADLRETPSGSIRITSADHVAETILWPGLRGLLQRYPDVQVEVQVDNGLADIVAERFDAGVRLGANIDKDMVAVPIGPAERLVVVGSPAYLERHPAPRALDDLTRHDCIGRRMPSLGGLSAWTFVAQGRAQRVRTSGRLTFDRPEMILQAALDGFGLAYVLESQARPHLESGRLLACLSEWCPSFPGYHLYYPSRRHHSTAFQLLVDALRYRAD